MQHSFRSAGGIVRPGDLKLLNEVFDRICLEFGFQKGSPEAEDISRATMSLFAAGVDDDVQLVESLKEYIHRKSPIPRVF